MFLQSFPRAISIILSCATLQAYGDTPDPARALDAQGMADVIAGRLKQGERNIAEAVRLAGQTQGEDHPDTAAYQTDLALALILQQKYERADALLRRALSVAEREPGPGGPLLGTILAEMSRSAAARNRTALAEQYALQSLDVLEKQPSPDRLAVTLARVNLGGVYVDSQKPDDAERLLLPAIEMERKLIPNSRPLAYALRRLAETRALQHNWTGAHSIYKEVIALYEATLGPADPELGPVLAAYAETLRREGASRSEVRLVQARAKSISGRIRPS